MYDVWAGECDKGSVGGRENRQGCPEAPLPYCQCQRQIGNFFWSLKWGTGEVL